MTVGSRYRAAGLLVTLAGLGLFAVLVYTTGPSLILAAVRRGGGAFLGMLALAGLRQLLRTAAWWLCIDPAHRTVSFGELFGLRLAGESVTSLTFAGPLLGESAKAVAASQRLPATESASSIFVENLLYSFTIVLFILSGALALVSSVALPHRTQLAVVGVGLALAVPLAVLLLAIRRRIRFLTGMLDRLARRRLRVGALERRRDAIRGFEQQVIAFYTGRPGVVAAVFLLELGTCAAGVAEAYLVLDATAGRASVFAAYSIESVNRAVNAVFPFLPLKLGVDEGGAALVLSALGYTAAEGVALAVVRKARTVALIAIGLVFVARLALWRRDRAPSRERR